MLMLMAMLRRAFGGSMARKLRAVLPDLGLNGEKEVEIEVRKRVIIVAVFEEWLKSACWLIDEVLDTVYGDKVISASEVLRRSHLLKTWEFGLALFQYRSFGEVIVLSLSILRTKSAVCNARCEYHLTLSFMYHA